MHIDRNQLIGGALVGALICFGGGYYAGKAFTVPGGQRGQFAGQFGQAQGQGQNGTRTGTGRSMNGFAVGTILSKDASSITVQLGGPAGAANGSASGSRIILLGDGTQVGKFSAGTAADLAVGQDVTVTGTPNGDGSITAQQIQIRPAGMTGPGFGGPRGGQ